MLTTKNENYVLTEESVAILEQSNVIPKNTDKGQIALFAGVCKELKLSPFTKEIYLLRYKDSYSTIVGINGLRKIAQSTGVHAGTSTCKFNLQPNGDYLTESQIIKSGIPNNLTATITVKKVVAGVIAEFSHTCSLKEFSSGKQKWATMPIQMLKKCAEAHALRKAFSISGVNTIEEVDAMKATRPVNINKLDDKDLCQLILNCTTMEELQKIANENADQIASSPEIHQVLFEKEKDIQG